MNPERWKRIDEIFHGVLDREPSVRAEFLAEACEGDDSLRIELERLIACHEKESNLCDRPPSDLAAALLAKEDVHVEMISHYRILKKIGRGGMGEVYLAEDTRLNRKVALKLLPPEFTKDKERVRRFEHEARVISALNHPNILTIHDIGQTESSSFIATEYINGESLRQFMHISKVSLKEVLTIVIQVAEALDAAHQTGIIHRDIKPENIMLRKDGYVKVLDFGLAKLTEPATGVSNLETRTQAGVVIGTFRYMSPEQARGLRLDARTDIFSLGVVLYELIAGGNPFDGATSSDVIAAILEKNPPPLHSKDELPEELKWITKKTLSKNLDERYQTIKDLIVDLKRLRKRLELDEELKGSAAVQKTNETSMKTAIAHPSAAKRRVATVFVVLVAVTLAGLTLLLFTQRESKKIKTSPRPFSKIKLTRLTSSGSAGSAAISPDGKYVAYLQETEDQESIYLKQLASGTVIQILTLPPSASFYGGLRFSRDGEYIYYLTEPSDNGIGSLYKMPVLGGISTKLADQANYVPAISPDGKKLAFTRLVKEEQTLLTAQADGSKQRKIGSHKYPDAYLDLEWSPDGKIIASVLQTTRPTSRKLIVGIHPDNGSEHPLIDLKFGSELNEDLEWLADGSGLILTKDTEPEGKRQIYHVHYPEGHLNAITNDLNDYQGVSLTKDSESLVTTQISLDFPMWIASSAEPDSAVQLTSGSMIDDGSMGLSWTPDGKIIYSSQEPAGEYQIWQIDPDGTNRKRITSGKPSKYYPVLSQDNRYIIYMTDELSIWRMDSDGGNQKPLTPTKSARFAKISPDSKWVICSTLGSEKQDLLKVALDGTKEVTLASHKFILGSAISPNMTQIAYVYQDLQNSPDFMVNIISFDGGSPLKSVRLERDAFPNGRIHWTPDGDGIAYIRNEEITSNIYVQPVDGSPARRLTNFATGRIGYFSWSLDGKRIAYSRGKFTSDIVVIQNVP